MPEENSSESQQNKTDNPSGLIHSKPVREPNNNSTRNKSTDSDKRPHWADTIIAIFTVLIFVTYLTSNYFSWRTLHEIKNSGSDTHDLAVAAKETAEAAKAQAEATKILAENAKTATKAVSRQADTSAKSAAAAEYAIRLTEVADIGIQSISCTPNSQLDINSVITITYQNTGRGAATKVAVTFHVGRYGANITPYVGTESESIIGAGGLLIAALPVKDSLTETELEAVHDGLIKFHAWGWVSYRDRFGGNHLLVHDAEYIPKSSPCQFKAVKTVGR
jgi:hypothetical protein